MMKKKMRELGLKRRRQIRLIITIFMMICVLVYLTLSENRNSNDVSGLYHLLHMYNVFCFGFMKMFYDERDRVYYLEEKYNELFHKELEGELNDL